MTEPQEIVASSPPERSGPVPTDWRFVRRPGWLLSHVFVAGCVVVFVVLGFWQLSRLDERKASNALVAARQESDPVPLASIVTPATPRDETEPIAYRRVTVTGRYDDANQVLIRNRSRDTAPGWWLVTPLITDDGAAVAINRGWVNYDIDQDGPLAEFAPPAGTVTVTGLVYPTQDRESGPTDAAEGVLRTLSRVDLGRYAQQLDAPLYPVYVNLQTSEPAQAGDLPDPVPGPELDEGPHLNYAGQWFIFATLTLIVYPLLLRRTARHHAEERAEEEAVAHPGAEVEPPPRSARGGDESARGRDGAVHASS